MFLSQKLITIGAYEPQPSKKSEAKTFSPFEILKLIGESAAKLELLSNIRIHPVVYVEHTSHVRQQLPEIALPRSPPFQRIFSDKVEFVQDVEQILAHRQKHRNFSFFTFFESAPIHKSEWRPLRDFVTQIAQSKGYFISV